MKIPAATHPGAAPRAPSGTAADGDPALVRTFEKAVDSGRATGAKRSPAEAGLDDADAPPAKTRKSKFSDGTYATREQEKMRVGIQTGSGTHQSEHVVGWAVAHPGEDRRTHRQDEGAMPAYHEVHALHRAHAGTGGGNDLEGRGWPTAEGYRHDQRASLSDPTARADGTSLSNAYQLNQLGYGHQMAHDGSQYSGAAPTRPLAQSNDSYAHMILQNPGLTHALTGQPVTDRLDAHGQAEALLAREAAHSGRWPTQERIDQVRRQVGLDQAPAGASPAP